jgi:hypothetical protein
VFEHTVEGLFRFSLRGRLSQQAWQVLRVAGIDLSKPLLPAYPYETWRRGFWRSNTLRSADNYVESRITELSPGACEVWLNEVMGQPAYYQGVLEACIALAGGQRVRTRVVAREGTGARLHVEWEE